MITLANAPDPLAFFRAQFDAERSAQRTTATEAMREAHAREIESAKRAQSAHRRSDT